ncbi:MAG: phosphate signaling complex protein PhoU [Eubacteriales bacterium]
MRSKFDEELSTLHHELIQMGSMCEEVIALASKALTEGDTELSLKVAPIDSEIDRMERTIESLCLRILLRQQPVAKDLRQVSAALKMITDMERIGDQAEDIAEIIRFLGGRTGGECEYISLMAQATIKMVTESVDAFVKQDISIAKTAIDHDDEVDDYFDKVKKSLISMISERPEDGEYAIDLLMIAKYFERIGDHAVNIAEWVVFSVTGTHKGENI